LGTVAGPSRAAADVARKSRRLPKFLGAADLTALLDAARTSSPRDYALVCVLAYAGLRVAEACALTWADISEDRLLVRHGKGDKERYVPLAPRLRAALADLDRREIPVLRHSPVFLSRLRRPLSVRAAQHIIERLCLAAGIDRELAHPHSLRHTAATMLLRRTGNIRLVQRFLGHASIGTTEIYTHVVFDDLAEAVERLE